tara:strand:- start:178 stop:483 length:306 start_codon:yes stop_codon:yes gene_type:complete
MSKKIQNLTNEFIHTIAKLQNNNLIGSSDYSIRNPSVQFDVKKALDFDATSEPSERIKEGIETLMENVNTLRRVMDEILEIDEKKIEQENLEHERDDNERT